MSNKVFLAFLIVAAIIVIGLVAWTGQKTVTQEPTTVNTDATVVEQNTTNKANPVVLEAGEDYALLVEAEKTVVGEITTYTFAPTNVLNVMPATMQSAVLNETPVKNRSAITIGETPAERLIISSAKDGSDSIVVQVVQGETLYDFRGEEDFLTNLSQYIEFSN